MVLTYVAEHVLHVMVLPTRLQLVHPGGQAAGTGQMILVFGVTLYCIMLVFVIDKYLNWTLILKCLTITYTLFSSIALCTLFNVII